MQQLRISPEANAYAAARCSVPQGMTGTIGRDDAAFLFHVMTGERPIAAAEVGVGSGVSTAFLSTFLRDRLPESRLYSFDCLEHVYNDVSKPVGAYLIELFAGLPENVVLAPGVSSAKVRSWQRRPEQFDFVFLDANHEHPWPCLDILSILDLVQPGALVVLHDIRLPLIKPDSRGFGPLYLFQTWPGEKYLPEGGRANIGAIRLFGDPAASAAALVQCAAIPWLASVPRAEWQSALEALSCLGGDAHTALEEIVRAPRMTHRFGLDECEIFIRGCNPWTRMSADLVSEPLVLHANPPGRREAAVVLRGLDTTKSRGIVFPSIERGPGGAVPLAVRFRLNTHDGFDGREQEIVVEPDTTAFAILLAPNGYEGAFDIEISLKLIGATDNIRGAWVRFGGQHFV